MKVSASKETLAGRMVWVLEGGHVKNAKRWSEEAGLNPSSVSAFITRAAEKPDADLEIKQVRALAKAASVDFAWLALGEGEAPAKAMSDYDRGFEAGYEAAIKDSGAAKTFMAETNGASSTP